MYAPFFPDLPVVPGLKILGTQPCHKGPNPQPCSFLGSLVDLRYTFSNGAAGACTLLIRMRPGLIVAILADMFQFIAGGGPTLTLIESPKEALQPREKIDEVVKLSLDAPDSTTIQASPQVLSETPCATIADREAAIAFQADIGRYRVKLEDENRRLQSRQNTTQKAFAEQILNITDESASYLTVAETIIKTIFKDLNPNTGDVLCLKPSDTTEKVARIIQDFVSRERSIWADDKVQKQFDFNFNLDLERQRANGPSTERSTLDYYFQILPIDLLTQVNQTTTRRKKPGCTSCIALNKKKKREETRRRCRNPAPMDKLTIDSLLDSLSTLERPRRASEAVPILLKIVDMVYCGSRHREIKRGKIFDLCHRLRKNSANPYREAEIKCLDMWLTLLVGDERCERRNVDDTKEASGVVKVESISATILDTTDSVKVTSQCVMIGKEGSSKAVHVKILQELVVFEDNPDYRGWGFKEHEYTICPSLTHDFKLYRWPKKLLHSTAEDLVLEYMHRSPPKTKETPGTIYVYQHKGFGRVKIGKAQDVEDRLEEWQKQCRIWLMKCDDRLQDINRVVKHPRRLESIIHAELKVERQRTSCQTYIVKKWTLWMQQDPYDDDGNFVPGKVEQPKVGDWKDPATKKANEPGRKSLRASKERLSTATLHRGAGMPPTHGMTTRSAAKLLQSDQQNDTNQQNPSD